MKSGAFLSACLLALVAHAATWTADNGNGTFTNPLFYDEFSDPDLIRVGADFYLTGTTMHAMPGLPVLQSRDLVNWRLLGYACDRLDLGPEYRLEGGREIYGQGFWAPCLRYHAGTFHLFSNVNHQTTQHLTATNPAGPWVRTAMKRSLHDLSVLFDDDGRAYVVWGYRDIQFARLTDDLTDIVPGTQRTLIPASAGMGEGLHFYKINGRYYITSAWYQDRMRMACARSDRLEGPYEVNPAISADEDFGLAQGYRLWTFDGPPFAVQAGSSASRGHLSMHQGGIVDTPGGEWWGFSMMDANSVGRLTCLSPVTWQDGWPWFGLPGNLGRTPRTWTKPAVSLPSAPSAPYERNDDFAGPRLQPVWQWNHVPDDTRWSLSERPGCLRLHPLAAPDFWHARNTLTQRAIGPESSATVVLEAEGLHPGDTAGLALLNLPYAWIGVRRGAEGLTLVQFDQASGLLAPAALPAPRVWLRVHCDFLQEIAAFSYSTDGVEFRPFGGSVRTVFQLKTFQGVRYALFAYNDHGTEGGSADFSRFTVNEPSPHGLRRPIPVGLVIRVTVHARDTGLGLRAGEPAVVPLADSAGFKVVDRGLGRVALQASDGRWLSAGAERVTLASGEPGDAGTFQWMETPYGDLTLLSLATHRYLRLDPAAGAVTAGHPGPEPGRGDGSCLDWNPTVF